MKSKVTFTDFILQEWLLIASGTGLILTAFYARRFPDYSIQEIQVLFILLILFITVNGLQTSGFVLKLAKSMESGKFIPLKLVLATFLFSMLVTNDVTLIVMVPLTLSLDINRKDILVILEALAANSGSALTPVGNPQNLYIFWFYDVRPDVFIKTIAPFSLVFLCLLIGYSLFLQTENSSNKRVLPAVNKKAYIYLIFLLIVLLTVFRVLPLQSGGAVIIFALIFDRKVLRIDYALLLSFLFFFGIADNLNFILAARLSHSGHIFILSALASQVMSNVPATLLFAKFTSNWPALLWGVNAGGFGSLFGSLANLIAYKIYIKHDDRISSARFTTEFFLLGYLSLFIAACLYFILQQTHALS